MDKETLLYNYFSNNLTPEQERRFDELLATDTGFKRQFDFEQDLQRAIKSKKNEELKEKLVAFEKNLYQKQPITKLPPKNYWKWAMAASIALLMGLGWLAYNSFLRTDYDELYNSNFERYPNTVYAITRGASDESIEYGAFVAYETGDFEKALEEFDRIAPENRKGYVDFYKAQSYMNVGEPKKAEKLFLAIIENDKEFVAESHWYLALGYLKTDQVKAAKKELQALLKDHDYKREAAESLLDHLD